MRIADLIMAIVMGIFSLYLMWKSSELPIGWIPDEGPGGGAWPFWLSTIMLISCLLIIWRWIRGTSPLSRSTETYIDPAVMLDVGQVAIALIITVALFYAIGVYGALPLFIIFYVRLFGKQTWNRALTLAFLTPVVTFFFFEIALKIPLPKGATEPAFYPLYKMFL